MRCVPDLDVKLVGQPHRFTAHCQKTKNEWTTTYLPVQTCCSAGFDHTLHKKEEV